MAAPSRKLNGQVLRSPSPASTFCNYRSRPVIYSSSGYASSTSSFSSHSTTFFQRSTSSTRVNVYSSSVSVRFSLNRSVSPNLAISVTGAGTGQVVKRQSYQKKRTCMCSPTTHPGSFQCSLQKNFGSRLVVAPYSWKQLNKRRSAMTNSLVRIRGVKGEIVKRALAALISQSSQHQSRRCEFRPRLSRLSVMSRAKECS